MPRATDNTDLRRHGRGDNVTGKVQAKSNLQDQRKAGQYAPSAPSAASTFHATVSAAKPPTAGVPVGQGKRRSGPKPGKLGGKE